MSICKATLKRLSKQRGKPVVTYGTLMFLKEGHSAILNKVWGHYSRNVGGRGYVHTSPVVRIIREGPVMKVTGLGQPTFETQYTIYTPAKANLCTPE